MSIDWDLEGGRCIELLRDLIRIPTINRGTRGEGDGNERPAAERLAEFLREAGVEPKLLAKEKGRANLVARVRGTGEKRPILLNAHLDVVDADASAWRHPPFAAEIHDGYVWGRGTIDMKHMAAMSACVLALLARRAREAPPLERDVILAAVADEEAGCDLGSMYLVDEHPDDVRAEYMLGEIGAFSLHLMGKKFYPIQVAEKGVCWVRATFSGTSGHGSMPDPDSAVVRLAEAVARLGRGRLALRETPVMQRFLEALARELPVPARQVLRVLGSQRLGGVVLDLLIRDPAQRRSFGALLANTAAPTVLTAGSKVNVIPGQASVDIDGRMLPGQSVEDLLAELRGVLGEGAELELLRGAPPVEASPDTPLFDHLARTLRAHDPDGHPLPYLIPGFTDAKAYSRLGTICYGFAPVRFDDPKLNFSSMYHGTDERVPVDGIVWGLRVLYEAVTSFCASAHASPRAE